MVRSFLKQTSNSKLHSTLINFAIQNVEELVTKTFGSGAAYQKCDLNEIFVNRSNASVRHSTCEYWREKKKSYHYLASHATFRLELQRHVIALVRTDSSDTKS